MQRETLIFTLQIVLIECNMSDMSAICNF